MTVEYKIEPNREQLREAIAFFEFVGGSTRDAMRIAINRAGPLIRTESSKQIRSQVRLKAKYVKDRLKFTRSTRSQLSGAIRTPSRGILLSRFSTDSLIAGDKVSWIKPPDVPPRGIKVKVKPTGTPKKVTGDSETAPNPPFYLVLRNGRLAIAARRNAPGPRGGGIKVFHGPSLSQVFDDVKDDVQPFARDTLTEQLADAMRFILAKRNP